MAILVVAAIFGMAADIADDYAVMDCGAIVLAGTSAAPWSVCAAI